MGKKRKIEQIVELEMNMIDPPKDAARMSINEDSIKEMADSIRERGQLQAIRVAAKNGRYEIIFGHRRFKATESLGRSVIKAVIVEMSEGEILLDRAVENIQKVDLTPLEEARQYDLLINKLGATFGKIARITGKSPGSVKRSLDILKMSECLQKELHAGRISKTVAEELQQCPDEDYKIYLCQMGADHGVTKDVARLWVDDYKKSLRTPGDASGGGDPPPFEIESKPTYITCYLCAGPVDVLKAEHLTLCKECKGQLREILQK